MTKTQRFVELMIRVYEKKRFTVEELAIEFNVSYRTMLRYLQELSGMGVPLYSEVGKNGGYSILDSKSRPTLVRNPALPFKRVVKPATYVVGVELKVPFTAVYMTQVLIPKLWEEFNATSYEVPEVQDNLSRIGAVMRRSEVFHYVAGVEVPNPHQIPAGMAKVILPTREYAVYSHLGVSSREETDESYLYLLEKLRKQGLDHDPTAYSLETFQLIRPDELNIYIPLK